MPDNNTADTSGVYGNIITVKFAQAQQPKFEERKGKGYIEFGINNDYPKYLLDLYNESPKHGAIIKGKANYIFGNGFKDIPKPANVRGESWNNIVKKCIKDDEIYSGYYLQVIYNLLGKISDVYHIEFHKVRTNKLQTEFQVKDDWADSKEKPRCYKVYDGKYDKDYPSRIIYIKQYNPRSDVYPLPSYFQGLNYIECDVQVSRYILGNAKDGFAAGKMIQFFNGEPTEENKGQVEKGIKKKFSGSEGDRYTIVFSKPGETPVQISDLGNTMLTKEDFTPVNNLIQGEIFACHQVTSPMLFGIKTEGQLGGRSEIVDAYEIFNNTYVNERQQAHEETFNAIFKLVDIPGNYKITPVEPLGFSIKDELLLDVMPREYFMDKLGVDQKYYTLPPARTQAVPGVPATDASGMPVAAANDNIKNLTGRQHQQVMRIVRQYMNQKMTKDQASLMLKSGYGFTDDDVNTFLGIENEIFTSQDDIEISLYDQFSTVGEDAGIFDELSRKSASQCEYFAEVKSITELEAKVLELIKKDPLLTAEVLATALNQPIKTIEKVMAGLEDGGYIKGGEPTGKKIMGDKPPIVDILLRYKYDWRSIVPISQRDSSKHPSRPFCVKMMDLNRLYSRADIETISSRLGYSVWDRVGGWWTMPDGTHSEQCRHEWHALTVIRKK